MKIIVEISQEDITKEVEKALLDLVKKEVAQKSNEWGVREQIKASVSKAWKETLDTLIEECLSQTDNLRVEVIGIIKAKLTAKITKLMSEK